MQVGVFVTSKEDMSGNEVSDAVTVHLVLTPE